MAELNIGAFDATQHKPLANFDPIPPGEYLAYISESDVLDTKAGDGQYATLTWIVAEGEYAERKVFDKITLANKSEKAVDFGRRQLADLCRAVGKLTIADTSELHELPVKIKVAIEEGQGNYGPKNIVKGYADPAATKPAATATVGAKTAPKPTTNGTAKPAAAAAPAGAKPLPWQKK